MAGDWIKLRNELPGDPRMLRIARECKVRLPMAIGACVIVWTTASNTSEDGLLPLGVQDEDIDHMGMLPGLSKSLRTVDWLQTDEASGRLRLPRFDRYIGSAKERALARERQRDFRSGRVSHGVTVTERDSHALSQNVTVTKRDCHDKKENEKERENKNENQSGAEPPLSGNFSVQSRAEQGQGKTGSISHQGRLRSAQQEPIDSSHSPVMSVPDTDMDDRTRAAQWMVHAGMSRVAAFGTIAKADVQGVPIATLVHAATQCIEQVQSGKNIKSRQTYIETIAGLREGVKQRASRARAELASQARKLKESTTQGI